VAERTLGWLMFHRRLAHDYETLPARSHAMIHLAPPPAAKPGDHSGDITLKTEPQVPPSRGGIYRNDRGRLLGRKSKRR